MIRRLAAVALLACLFLLLLAPVRASSNADPTSEPTPTVQPTPESFDVEVIVETQGIGIPDDALLETGFGDRSPYRHENLGPNHYRDFLQVRMDRSVMWIFEHEGDLGIGGQRSDESWALFPYIVPAPLALSVMIHNPTAACQDPTVENCGVVIGNGDKPVLTLDHDKSYDITLRVDYARGGGYNQDSFTVTTTIQ